MEREDAEVPERAWQAPKLVDLGTLVELTGMQTQLNPDGSNTGSFGGDSGTVS